jgi:prepilin-type N-terminal cleavage/methylation domain-containing protein
MNGRQQTRGVIRAEAPAAFTLLEVMVAMLILAIIVIIMANVFRHSQIAFDSGVRKTQMNMEGRAILDFINRELSQAIMDPVLAQHDGSTVRIETGQQIEFFTVGTPDNTNREARLVRYRKQGDTVFRRELPVVNTRGYPVTGWTGSQPPEYPMVSNVVRFIFRTPGDLVYTTNLPSYVDVELVLRKANQYSAIRAWSVGRDHIENTQDDVCSWKFR